MSSFLLVLIFFNLEQKLFFWLKRCFRKKNDFRRLNTSVKIWIRFQLFKSNLFHGNYPNLSSIRALWIFWTQLKPFVFRFSLSLKINLKKEQIFYRPLLAAKKQNIRTNCDYCTWLHRLVFKNRPLLTILFQLHFKNITPLYIWLNILPISTDFDHFRSFLTILSAKRPCPFQISSFFESSSLFWFIFGNRNRKINHLIFNFW